MSLSLSGEFGFAGLSLGRTPGSISMKRAIVFVSLFASAAVGFAQQNKDPVTSVVKEILPHQEKNLVAAVEEMPADRFGYKPTAAADELCPPGPAHDGIEQLPLRQGWRRP